MKYRLEIDVNQFQKKKLEPRTEFAQKWLDNEVVKDCYPYVPYRSGRLADSSIISTKLGSGKVRYNTPYARRVYYGRNMHFSTDRNTQACAFWFEKAKAANKEKWLNGVKKIMTPHD